VQNWGSVYPLDSITLLCYTVCIVTSSSLVFLASRKCKVAYEGWQLFARVFIMATKLYIGNLSYQTTDGSLQAAFAQAGTVASARVIMDKMTGRSRGFGFVEMATEAEAEAAIDMWNGKDLDGRPLRVNIARPMEERPPRRFDN
jgi:hypothetical protein